VSSVDEVPEVERARAEEDVEKEQRDCRRENRDGDAIGAP
jgi:hypothetical protein